MSKLIVASAQQQMRLFDSSESYRKELNRFLHMAHAKGARLIVFPALSGVMAASHRVEGFRIGLLKQADGRKRGKQSLWARTRNALAGGTAALLGANFRRAFVELLKSDPAALVADYEPLFAELASAYAMTIVAGTSYLPDATGVTRHRAVVFGPDGTVLGRHDKLAISQEDEGLASAGDDWHVINTPVGRLGILIGEEALYPEAGRVLAYQGADLLVTLGATANEALAAYVRQGTIAQAQENRIFALTSFLVGKNYLSDDEGLGAVFVGRSGIYAPLELTLRYTGVLVEMGTSEAEGLLTAELDRGLLHKFWADGAEPVRTRMPVDLFAAYLPALYSSRRTLADVWPDAGAGAPGAALLPAPREVEQPEPAPWEAEEPEPAPWEAEEPGPTPLAAEEPEPAPMAAEEPGQELPGAEAEEDTARGDSL